MLKNKIEAIINPETGVEEKQKEAAKITKLSADEVIYITSQIEILNNKIKVSIEKTINKKSIENKEELFEIYQTKLMLEEILIKTNNQIDDAIFDRFKSFRNELFEEIKKEFPQSLHKPFHEIMIMTMYICLGLAVGERIVIKVGEQKFDLRIHNLFCAPPGSGKKFIADLLVKVAKVLNKEISKGGSTHIETFIGKNLIEIYHPFRKDSINSKFDNLNLFLASNDVTILQNIKIKGVLNQHLHIDEEFTKKIEEGTTKEEMFQYLNTALDPFGSNLLEKRLIDNSKPLKYHPRIVFTGCIQDKKISQDYYDLGVYRRCPIMYGKKANVKTYESAFSYSLNNELNSEKLVEIIKNINLRTKNLMIKTENQGDGIKQCNIKDYPHKNNVAEGDNNYSESLSVFLFDNDLWKICEYSNIKIDIQASMFVSIKIKELFETVEKRSFAGVGFRNYLDWYFRTLFFKFAILIKIGVETNVYSRELEQLEITETDVKVVYNDIKKVFENMFSYYEMYNNPEEKDLNKELEKLAGSIIKRLNRNGHITLDTAVSIKDFYNDFPEDYRKSYSTFYNKLKLLIEKGYITRVSLGKRIKGEPGVLIYVEDKVETLNLDIDN